MIKHLGIIMDGNRRWAKERLLPSVAGHKSGAENIKKLIPLCIKHNIDFVTLWALSTDNLHKRNQTEVKGIIKLINSIETFLGDFFDNGIRFELIGNLDLLPIESKNLLLSIKEKTKNNDKITLTIGLGYGGQDEIIRATKNIINSGIDPEKLTTQEFKKYLDTHFLPNPDLIVRTGGDIRHSGFLLFDSQYSEYYFTEKKWPEFDEDEFNKMISFYNNSKRNFGK